MTTLAINRPAHTPLVAAALAGVGALSIALVLLMDHSTYDTWGAIVLAPILVLVSYPILARAARREGDSRLLGFLLLALVVKLVSAFVRYYVISDVYGRGDAFQYHHAGIGIADRFHDFDFTPGPGNVSGTGFIRLVTGIVYTVTGPTLLGGFLVFSWFAFWGLYFWYRAFRLAVPAGATTTYARLLFFLPSMLFWPSSIGKEAWLTFTLGLAVFGVARLMTGRIRGLFTLGLGLWLSGMVRPHIALLVIAAATIAYGIRKAPAHTRTTLGPIGKLLGVTVLVGLTFVLIGRTESYFEDKTVKTQSVGDVFKETQRRSSQGGSAFQSRIVDSPADVPRAVLAVLFRPLPTEAHNMQALLSALESSFLALLVVVRFPWILYGLRNVRHVPYLAFAAVYVVVFCAAFGAVGNFGIIARQRVLMLPAFVVLFALPPPKRSMTHAS